MSIVMYMLIDNPGLHVAHQVKGSLVFPSRRGLLNAAPLGKGSLVLPPK